MNKRFLIFTLIFLKQIENVYTLYLNECISGFSHNGSYDSPFISLEEFYSRNTSINATNEEEILIFQSDVHCKQHYFENSLRMTFK